jgi:hypothetical protein
MTTYLFHGADLGQVVMGFKNESYWTKKSIAILAFKMNLGMRPIFNCQLITP